VTAGEIESDFGRLVKLLAVRHDALGLMTELAIQVDKLRNPQNTDVDPEAEKREAIAVRMRRIDAAINLYSDGVISREEYLRRVELNKREITYWEARTTESEKAALELAMCMEAVEKLARLWDAGDDEDKQGMARSLFSYIVYDLDIRRIVDFRLKPWADRFLVLRTALYDTDSGEDLAQSEGIRGTKLNAPDVAPEGFEDSSSASIEKAVQSILRLLYAGMELPSEAISDYTPTKDARNDEIYQRYLTGERAVDLAREYRMSLQRIYKIIRNQKKR
jgi:hypothetical protein